MLTTYNHRIRSEQVIRFLLYISLAGGLFIIGYSFRFVWTGQQRGQIIVNLSSIASLGALIAGASLVLGGLGGFLFGIPKILQNNSEAPVSGKDNGSKSTYLHNDNLVQISDWLTKILVGVGLTQLTNIPPFLWKVGNGFKAALGNDDVAVVCAICIILFYTGTGFLLSYIWTRVYFRNILAQSDNDLDDLKQEYESILSEKEKEIENIVAVNMEPISAKSSQNDSDSADPNKGQFGGSSNKNERVLSATVSPADWSDEWFKVNLEVSSSNLKNPLTGVVKFYLHPSFKNPILEAEAVNGIAKITLVAWGAFTVGAEADKGITKLELDLAELVNAPQLFKDR